MAKKLDDEPHIKGMIAGSKISLIFLIALVIFGYRSQFSIILALVAGVCYGLLVNWWHGKEEPPAQPLIGNLGQVLPQRKGRNTIALARDERKKQAQLKADRAKARAEDLKKRQRPAPPPGANQGDQNTQDDSSTDQN